MNRANENSKKHCGALDALKQAVGIETDCEDANNGKCIAEAIKRKVGDADGMNDGFIRKVFENGESDLVKTQCEPLSMDLECSQVGSGSGRIEVGSDRGRVGSVTNPFVEQASIMPSKSEIV